MIEVKEIQDIPDIEKHLDKEFILELYDKGDNIQIYEYKINSIFYLSVEICSKEKVLECKAKLIDLITQDDIKFLRFSLENSNSIVGNSSWVYKR